MPLAPVPLRVDVTAQGLRLDRGVLAQQLAALPAGVPVVAMVHGFRFAPDAKGNCPHGHIFSLSPPSDDWKVVSWPRLLGLNGARGLGIGFGWRGRGAFVAVSLRARAAGRALAELARGGARSRPGPPL
jgi:hypothetical protein